MVKTFQNLLQNRMFYIFKLGMQHGGLKLYKVCIYGDPVDLDLFYGKVKFGNLGFSIGKSVNSRFFQKLEMPVT